MDGLTDTLRDDGIKKQRDGRQRQMKAIYRVDFSHGKCFGKFFFILPNDLSEVAKIVAGHLNGQKNC